MIGGIPPEKGMCDEYVIRLREADQSIYILARSMSGIPIETDVSAQTESVIEMNLKESDIRKLVLCGSSSEINDGKLHLYY